MSKKIPDMNAFLGVREEPDAPKPEIKKQATQKRPGRPKKPTEDLAKQTAIRLDPEDLRRIKKLAIDDSMTFNRVVYRALEAYCATRGIKLIGA